MQERSLRTREHVRQRQDTALESQGLGQKRHNLAQTIYLRSTQIVALAESGMSFECEHKRLHHVPYVYRLQARIGAGQRKH